MSNQKKYDTAFYEKIKDDDKLNKANEFHKLRTAFMIIENKVLYLTNSTMTHYEWAQSLGLAMNYFDEITRGFVNDGFIVFYKGNFDYDDKIIEDANAYAGKVAKHCKLKSANVYVGMKIGKIGKKWSPNKYLFSIETEKENI